MMRLDAQVFLLLGLAAGLAACDGPKTVDVMVFDAGFEDDDAGWADTGVVTSRRPSSCAR